MEKLFCSKCGTKLDKTSIQKFCSNCGNSLEYDDKNYKPAQEINTINEDKPVAVAPVKNANGKFNKKKAIIFYSIIIVLCAAVLVKIFIYDKIKNRPENVAKEFLQHMEKKEYAEAKELATAESATLIDQVGSFDLGGKKEKEAKIEDMNCEINENTASCTYHKNGEIEKIDLVKTEGKWLVEFKKESSTNFSRPEDAAESFLQHMDNKEYADAKKLATEESASAIDQVASFDTGVKKDKEKAKIEDMNCNVNGDRASCTYKKNGSDSKIDLVKKDGKWLVDFKKESSSAQPSNNSEGESSSTSNGFNNGVRIWESYNYYKNGVTEYVDEKIVPGNFNREFYYYTSKNSRKRKMPVDKFEDYGNKIVYYTKLDGEGMQFAISENSFVCTDSKGATQDFTILN